jgi:NADH:ubiquinone oxidoreductase subunit 6 (subunit J)
MPKGVLGRSNSWYAARTLFSGLLMVAAVWSIRTVAIPDIFRLLLIVTVGGIIFLILGLVTRVITREDMNLVKILTDKLFGRFGRKRDLDEVEAG